MNMIHYSLLANWSQHNHESGVIIFDICSDIHFMLIVQSSHAYAFIKFIKSKLKVNSAYVEMHRMNVREQSEK